MSAADIVNGTFELSGGAFILLSIMKALREKSSGGGTCTTTRRWGSGCRSSAA